MRERVAVVLIPVDERLAHQGELQVEAFLKLAMKAINSYQTVSREYQNGAISWQTKLQEFLRYWGRETDGTLALMRALPTGSVRLSPTLAADR